MAIKEFIEKLKGLGFFLVKENDRLILKAYGKKVKGTEIEAIKKNQEVITYIKENKQALMEYIEVQDTKMSVPEEGGNIASVYKLTPLQAGMLFHGLYAEGEGVFTAQLMMELVDVRLADYLQCWEVAIRRHSIFRSGFYYDAFRVPVQCVYKEARQEVTMLDYRGMSPEEQAAAVRKYEEHERKRNFSFRQAPLMRLTMIRLADQRYRAVWTHHLIVFDGWSLPILVKELLESYDRLTEGQMPEEGPEDRYEDYVRYLGSRNKYEEETYWKGYLKGLESNCLLPFIDNGRERNKGKGAYGEEPLRLDKETTGALMAYAQRQRITVNTLMQGLWAYLLSRYTGNKSVVYGVTVSGRPEEMPGVEDRIGIFTNTLPLYTRVEETVELGDWLQSIQEQQLQSRQFQYSGLNEIQGWIGRGGDLFDSILVFENYPVNEMVRAGKWRLQVEKIEMREKTNYPLTLLVVSGEQLEILLRYNRELLGDAIPVMIRDHMDTLLKQLAREEVKTIGDWQPVSTTEQQWLLSQATGLSAGWSPVHTLTDLLWAQEEKTPARIAVTDGENSYSYRELSVRSNQLGNYLRRKGIREDGLVGMYMEKSIAMITGIAGILKAGGAYVPMEPDYPDGRVRYIIEDTGVKWVISSGEPAERLRKLVAEWGLSVEVIVLENEPLSNGSARPSQESGWLLSEPATLPVTELRPEHLAYIIYTSGSTGRPKGVMVEHRQVVRLLKPEKTLFDFGEGDVWSMFHSYCFDVSVWELFGALLFGGRLVLVSGALARDTPEFGALLIREGVTVLSQTPSAYYILQEQLEKKAGALSLRYIIFAGEALNPAKLKRLVSTCRLINMYGITETTVHSTYKDLDDTDLTSSRSIVGVPIPTLQLYILSKEGALSPMGVGGEIYVGGEGVTRGYLNRESLTAQRFLPDTFSGRPQARLYRSGDLARWLPEGGIEYLGRMDDQVKIRGYRIEPGEIESQLMQSGLVRQAAVLARKDAGGDYRLIGYVVPGESYAQEALAGYLRGRLPDYMMPGIVVELAALPLTANGKLDRNALPDPEMTGWQETYVAPRNRTEQVIAGIWEETLGIDRAGVYDDFFRLGGDSIKVIRVLGKLQKVFGGNLKLADVYNAGNLEGLARLVDRPVGGASPLEEVWQEISREVDQLREAAWRTLSDPQLIEDVYPMSDIQKGMIYASLRNPGLGLYHDQFVYPFVQEFDAALLVQALELLVQKHATLRTAFDLEADAGALQLVYKTIPVVIEQLDLRHLAPHEERDQLNHYLEQQRGVPFEPGKAPLWRAAVCHLPDRLLIAFQCHHSILDGWSVASLHTELDNLYATLKSGGSGSGNVVQEPLKCTMKDFILEGLAEKRLEENREFWKHEMAGYRRLDIFSREPIQEKEYRVYAPAYLGKLKEKIKKDQLSLKGVLLGAYLYALGMLTYEDELTIGLVSNIRPLREDGDKLLGCFLNTIPLRVKKDSGPVTWRQYFQRVEQQLLGIKGKDRTTLFDITQLAGEKYSDNNPFFDVLFDYLDFHVYEGLEGDLYESNQEISREREQNWMDLDRLVTNTYFDCVVNVTGEKLTITYFQQRKLRSGKTAEDVAAYVDSVLESYLHRYTNNIQQETLLSEIELRHLLHDFNDTTVAYPAGATIISLFEQQVRSHPQATALLFGEEQLTYQGLNERADRLSRHLVARGVRKGMMIPLCAQRSPEMIIGLLGILKTGAAYVPVDPDLPEQRIGYILEDIGARWGVSYETGDSRLRVKTDCQVISLSDLGDVGDLNDLNDLGEFSSLTADEISTPAPEDLAYVIYTSGSTGQPKGVMVEHQGVVNLARNQAEPLKLRPGICVLQFSSISFDASCYEIFGTLLNGGQLVLARSSELLDPNLLKDLLIRHAVELVTLPPSFQAVVRDELSSLKTVVSAGEMLQVAQAREIMQKGIRLINAYGPTENTVCATLSRSPVDSSGLVTIGKPIDNVQVYITGRNSELLPVGVPGELCLSGIQVARGYFNRPDLTDRQFIQHPFDPHPGTRYYKTGDLARWLPDGNIEYLGRIDEQVKIRGYRIEPGEIENTIQASGLVDKALVLVRMDTAGARLLTGYVIPRDGYDKDKLFQHLQSWLPAYMVPDVLIEMTSFPLNSSGKVDKKELPEPGRKGAVQRAAVAPRNDLERQIAAIWQEVMQIDEVSVTDSFFEAGGNSLLAIRFVSALRKQLSVELPLAAFFQLASIEAIARFIRIARMSETAPEDNLVSMKL